MRMGKPSTNACGRTTDGVEGEGRMVVIEENGFGRDGGAKFLVIGSGRHPCMCGALILRSACRWVGSQDI